jgi:hypothetical protein
VRDQQASLLIKKQSWVGLAVPPDTIRPVTRQTGSSPQSRFDDVGAQVALGKPIFPTT